MHLGSWLCSWSRCFKCPKWVQHSWPAGLCMGLVAGNLYCSRFFRNRITFPICCFKGSWCALSILMCTHSVMDQQQLTQTLLWPPGQRSLALIHKNMIFVCFGKSLQNQFILREKVKLSIDNVLSKLEATFMALKNSGNASWKNQFPVQVWFFLQARRRVLRFARQLCFFHF